MFARQSGWSLWAEQRGEDSGCGPETFEPVVTDLGGGWHRVTPVGPAGEYDLWLNAASGPGLPLGGTVGATQSFVTAADGSQATAELAVPTWACDQPGDVTLSADVDAEAARVLADGGTFTVELVLDGRTHTASGDVRTQQSNVLKFTPALR